MDAARPGHLVVITGLPGSGKTTLAQQLAASLPAVRLCPDDWMMAAGIDLWDARTRASIEQFQFRLLLDLLHAGTNVVNEWGTWSRRERDELRAAAQAIGATVELVHTTAPIDVLWQRVEQRDREGTWGERPITRADMEEWAAAYEAPTDDEFATYDS